MPYAELDGLRLYYERAGSGEPELLFVPGWCCDRTAFRPQFEHFARSHAVTALDLRVAVRATVRRTATRFPTWPTILRDSAPRSGSRSRLLPGIASAE